MPYLELIDAISIDMITAALISTSESALGECQFEKGDKNKKGRQEQAVVDELFR
jgi:hypothetical protein